MPLAIFPYETDFRPFNINDHKPIFDYLSTFKETLANAKLFGGKTKVEGGFQWFEYGRLTTSKLETPYTIAQAFVATHNHFWFEEGSEFRVYKHSAPIIKLKQQDYGEHMVLVALLNTNIVAFFLKQLCHSPGTENDPVRARYQYASTMVGKVPIPNFSIKLPPEKQILLLAEEISSLARTNATFGMKSLFYQSSEAYSSWYQGFTITVDPDTNKLHPFVQSNNLHDIYNHAIRLREQIKKRMIFLQEEMDWLAYEMYGLIKKAPLARDYLTPSQYEKARLQLGQRAFELAGNGYTGDWLPGYQPDPLPEELKALTEARIALIQSNKDIALLEDPLYKRRWIPPNYEQEFRDAAHWWLAEKLEYALEQYGKPISLRRWAREMSRDGRVMATLEVLSGSPMFDVEIELHQIIQANAVPNRPEHYLKPSGLRQVSIPGTEFKSSDFSDSTAWKLRGKLNIPRERFIAYTEFDHTQRGADVPDGGGPWYGWAGWNEAQRADALTQLLDRANRAGWQLHWQQCGLRATLRQLLQQGKLDHLPAQEKLEFEGIAGMCGISLDTPCYCRAYREGIAQGDPGVPSVTPEILAVKVLSREKKKGHPSRRKDDNQADQLRLDI